MRWIFLFLVLLVTPAVAQTGSAKTNSQLNTEINSSFPDNTNGLITPFALRQFTLDSVASFGNLSGVNTWSSLQTFSSGIITSNIYSDSVFLNSSTSGSPTFTLSNTTGGLHQGGGYLVNALNSTPSSVTVSYVNCGFNNNTAGSELGECDFGYRGPSATNRIITTAVNSSSAGCMLCSGNDDNFWSLGFSSVGWANVYSHLLTVIGLSGGNNNPTPPIQMGSFAQTGTNCVSHVALYGSTFGFGVGNSGFLNMCSGSGSGMQFFVNGAGTGTTPTLAISSAGVISSAGTAAVNCSGTPSSSFAVVNGIVTHC